MEPTANPTTQEPLADLSVVDSAAKEVRGGLRPPPPKLPSDPPPPTFR